VAGNITSQQARTCASVDHADDGHSAAGAKENRYWQQDAERQLRALMHRTCDAHTLARGGWHQTDDNERDLRDHKRENKIVYIRNVGHY